MDIQKHTCTDTQVSKVAVYFVFSTKAFRLGVKSGLFLVFVFTLYFQAIEAFHKEGKMKKADFEFGSEQVCINARRGLV